MARENVTTVYELIKMLTEFPPNMPVAAAVIGEQIEPLNSYADGSVDIDIFSHVPEISANVTNTYKGTEYVRLEVVLL
jgi:hypothetical protein